MLILSYRPVQSKIWVERRGAAGYKLPMQMFTNLVPLLLLVLVIFGLLITAALILRATVRKNLGAAPVGKTSSPTAMRRGDVAVVLGRMYQVGNTQEITLAAGSAFLFILEREDGPARLIIAKDLGYAYYLPNKGERSDEGFPEIITRKEGNYARQGAPLDSFENLKIALYAGPSDRWLLAESAEKTKILWSGKAIPVEGVTVLTEK
jgi:hypothetical protein